MSKAIHTRLRNYVLPFTIFSTPVWRMRILEDDIEPGGIVTEVFINSIEYTKVLTQSALRNTEKSWFLDNVNPIRIFLHFDNHDPPFFYTDLILRVEYPTEPIINNIVTYKDGDFLAADTDINIITFREREI